MRILVVDDEAGVRDLLTLSLGYEGWLVCSAGTGGEAVREAGRFHPDAVVVGPVLPDMEGPELVRRLRSASPALPVLMLTAEDSGAQPVAKFSGSGCLAKPFRLEELTARLYELLRRTSGAGVACEPLVLGDLSLDESNHVVTRDGQLIQLTRTEFELLHFFMRNPRRVLSKAQILDRVWNYDFAGRANIVELYVSYLRRKIDKGRAPMIHTVRGVGYVLKPPRA